MPAAGDIGTMSRYSTNKRTRRKQERRERRIDAAMMAMRQAELHLRDALSIEDDDSIRCDLEGVAWMLLRAGEILQMDASPSYDIHNLLEEIEAAHKPVN